MSGNNLPRLSLILGKLFPDRYLNPIPLFQVFKLYSIIIGSKYLSGNNLPLISLIRGKLFPDRYLNPIPPC